MPYIGSSRYKYSPYLTIHFGKTEKFIAGDSVMSLTDSVSIMQSWIGVLVYSNEFRYPVKFDGNIPEDIETDFYSVFEISSLTGVNEPYIQFKRTKSSDFRSYLQGIGNSGYNYQSKLPPIVTIEMWVKLEEAGYTAQPGPKHGGLLGFSGNNSYCPIALGWINANPELPTPPYFYLSTSKGGNNFGETASISWTFVETTLIIYDNTWRHIVLERNKHVWSFFVDGKRILRADHEFSASVSIPQALQVFYTYLTNPPEEYNYADKIGASSGIIDSIRITMDEVVYGDTLSFSPPIRLIDKWRILYHFDNTLSAPTTINNTMFGKSFYNGNSNYFSISALGSAAISDIKYKFGTSSLKCSGGYFRTSESRMTVLGRSRFTIDFWLNPDSTLSAKSYIFDSRGRQFSSDTAIESLAIHGTDDGKIVFKWGDNSPILSSTIAISVNTWTHIAIECNSLNIVSAYINGNLIGNSTVTASIGSGSRNIFTLGGSSLAPNGTGVYLGHIDEFRFMLHTAAYSQTSFLPPTSSYYDRGLPGKI